MTIGEKIKLQRKALGLTQTELGAKLGVQKNAVSKWECGRVDDIPSSKIKAMAQLFNVPPSYLIDDNSYFTPPTVTDDVTTFYIQTSVAAHYNAISDDETLEGDKVEVPTSYLCSRPPEDYCAMRVKGNSMYPQFHDGDVVIVLKQATLNHSGQIGVICYGDEQMTIKRINYVDGENWLELVPLNPEFPPKRIEGADLEQCKVIGLPRILIRHFE